MFKMKSYLRMMLLLSSLFLLLGCTATVDHPHAGMGQKVHVHGAWVRAVPPVSHMSAAYLTLINHGEKEDQLLSVETELAKVVELHNVKKKDGMMSMFPVPFVPVPAGGEQNLKPGSYHIMLINLTQTPKLGEKYDLVLHFKHAGVLKVSATVREGQPMKKEMHKVPKEK
ncbi:MAG: copper chaperone PCu(A)C [SAR324 cluster bacterium]|nr:copper chaperone PCu(A)C [SAR324 cluster bacterium]MBL7035661.1 copper chaperone PCu(A)C [SAR324 cluster bacterium]